MAFITPKLSSGPTGYWLDIINITDSFETSLATYEFPFTNKNEIEDLGQKTRRISINCVFQDNPPIKNQDSSAQIPTYEEHFFFLDFIKSTRNEFTLTHPAYGEITGKISNVSASHDDTINFVKIEFDFLEIYNEENQTPVDLPSNFNAKSFRSQNDDVLGDINSSQSLSDNLVAFRANLTSNKNTFDSHLASVTSPSDSIIYTIYYADDLPSQYIQSLNGVVDRIVQINDGFRSTPASFLNKVITNLNTFKANLSGTDANRFHIMAASRLAYEAALTYESDDENRQQIIRKEQSPTFDINGNRIGEIETLDPAMTVTELEISLSNVRSFINTAIGLDRENRSLNNQARSLQD